MKSDLRGLAQHLGNLFAYSAILALVVAGIVFFTGRDETSGNEHTGVVIVLVVLAIQELIIWFGLIVWADTAEERS